jgi:hypothetical protein
MSLARRQNELQSGKQARPVLAQVVFGRQEIDSSSFSGSRITGNAASPDPALPSVE